LASAQHETGTVLRGQIKVVLVVVAQHILAPVARQNVEGGETRQVYPPLEYQYGFQAAIREPAVATKQIVQLLSSICHGSSLHAAPARENSPPAM